MEQTDLDLQQPNTIPSPLFAPGQTVAYYGEGVTLFKGRVVTVTAATHDWGFSEWHYYIEGRANPVPEYLIRAVPREEYLLEDPPVAGFCPRCGEAIHLCEKCVGECEGECEGECDDQTHS